MRAKKVETKVRKDQIARAALDLVGSNGVQALNIIDIAKRIGFVPSAVYRHFSSKEEILSAAVDLIHANLMSNINVAREKSPKILEQLEALLTRQIQLISKSPAIPQIIFSEGVFGESDIRRAKVKRVVTDFLNEIENIIQEGQSSGELRPDIDPMTAAILFKGLLLPVAMLRETSNGTFDLSRHAKGAWEMYRMYISETAKA